MMFALFSFMLTFNIWMRYSQERLRIRLLSQIEVVVVPSLVIRGRQYPLGIPKDSPSNQHAQ